MTLRVAELGPRIGGGRTADVFGLDDDRVIKLFHHGAGEDAVRHEMDIARLAAARLAEGIEDEAAALNEIVGAFLTKRT